MKSTLLFEFDDHEQILAKIQLGAQDLYNCLRDMEARVQNRLKHGELSCKEADFLDEIRTDLRYALSPFDV